MVIGVVKLEMSHVTRSLWSTRLKSHLAVSGSHCPSGSGDQVFFNITWSHDQWVTWLNGLDTLTLNHKGYGKSNRTLWPKYICITNWGKLVLQLEQLCFITNKGKRCYKLGKVHYYKLGQMLLQVGATITN